MANQAGVLEAPAAVKTKKPTSLWGDAYRRLLKNRLAVVGAVIVIFLMIVAVLGPYLTPFEYQAQDLAALAENRNRPIPPFQGPHILGTDGLGRDLLSRLMDGARISMTVALIVQIVVLAIGVPVGAAGAGVGGRRATRHKRRTHNG